MEGYMLSVGYPVGVNVKNRTYEIELADKIVELTVEEMQMWVKAKTIDMSNLSQEEKELFDALIRKGAAVFDNTAEGLFDQIKSFKYVRQGAVAVNDNKVCLSLGRDVVYIVKEQYLIWKFGDSNTTIAEAQEYMYPKLSSEEFLISFISLMVGNLLWIL